MKPARKYMLNLMLLATACAIAVLLCEGVLRVVAPQQQLPEWYRDDPVYGRMVKPNFHQAFTFLSHDVTMDVRTNALGMRDVELPADRGGEKTVLFVGDSFVFGYGINIEDRLDAVLRKRFADTGFPIQTINAGVPGWGTIQQSRWVADHLDQLDPDVIVWVYCGNDQANDRDVLSGASAFREGGLFYLPGKTWLRTHSHLYRLLLYLTAVSRQRMSARMQAHEQPAAHVDTQSAEVISEDDWARTAALLREVADRFRKRKPDGIFLLAATAPEDPLLTEPLKKIATDIDARYVDVAAETNAIPPDERRLPWDSHWSPRMHEVMANGVFTRLQPHDPEASRTPLSAQ
jgi:lysophospholipase L1-like esterase